MAKQKTNALQKDNFALYQINSELNAILDNEEAIDFETGEIKPEAAERIKALELKREDLIHFVGLSYFTFKAKKEAVDLEVKRLTEIKRSIARKEELAKKILSKNVFLGEEFDFQNLIIKWKKNPPSVEVDPDLDLLQLANEKPELVKVEYSLDKIRIKEMAKEGLPLPEGIRIVQDNSLLIK